MGSYLAHFDLLFGLGFGVWGVGFGVWTVGWIAFDFMLTFLSLVCALRVEPSCRLAGRWKTWVSASASGSVSAGALC